MMCRKKMLGQKTYNKVLFLISFFIGHKAKAKIKIVSSQDVHLTFIEIDWLVFKKKLFAT
jgi:hypothetical protein